MQQLHRRYREYRALRAASSVFNRICYSATVMSPTSFRPLRIPALLILAISSVFACIAFVLVFLTMFYWLWRVRGRVSLRGQPAT